MNLGSKEYRDQVRLSGGFKKALHGLVVRHIRENPYIPTPNERTPIALGFMMCLCLALAVFCLAGFHFYLLLSAQTTIEFHGNFRKRKISKWKNPYSAGSCKRNWDFVYGTKYFTLNDEVKSEDEYIYRGCWGVLMQMMPSSREPEFLPIPINGQLIRRKNIGKLKTDALNGAQPESENETEFLMKSTDDNGGLVERSRGKTEVVESVV